jgi:hypothetical protein
MQPPKFGLLILSSGGFSPQSRLRLRLAAMKKMREAPWIAAVKLPLSILACQFWFVDFGNCG